MAKRSKDFDWMDVPARPHGDAAFRVQFEKAVRERAKLLFNLRFPAAETTKRILAGLAWEFDASVWPKTPPAFLGEVPGWVDDVYLRMTPTRA